MVVDRHCWSAMEAMTKSGRFEFAARLGVGRRRRAAFVGRRTGDFFFVRPGGAAAPRALDLEPRQ